MNFFKRLSSKFNHVVVENKKILTDEEYYTQLFTKDPEWNNTNPNGEERDRWQIIEQFIFYIKGVFSKDEGKTFEILDLGCGRGWLTNLLSGYGTVTGIEPIKPVVEYAKKIYPKLNLMNGTSKDLLEKNLQGKFDIVVSSEVIEHIPDQNKPTFISDIKSLLKDNGYVIITTPRKEAEDEWEKYCSPDQPIEEWITELQLKSIFESQGFKVKLFKRLAAKPMATAPEIELYQLCLFQKIQ